MPIIESETVTPTQTVTPEVKTDQNTKVETTKTPEIEAVSPRLAAIAKRDKAALVAMRAAKAKEAEADAKLAAAKEIETKYAKRPANPIEALMAGGYSYKDATEFVLNGAKVTPELEIRKLRSEIDEDKKARDEAKRAYDDAQLNAMKEQQRQALENFQTQINDFVESKPDDYELILLHGHQSLILEVIDEHFKKTQKEGKAKIMSTKEAADLVEKHLADVIEESLAKSKKFAGRLNTKTDKKEDENDSGASARTLSNSMTSSTASKGSPRNEMERIQRALAAMGKTG